MLISVRHTGMKSVIGRTRILQHGAGMVTHEAVREGLEYARDEAIAYLNSVAGWRKGMSGADSILNPENWRISFDRLNSAKLECISPHAGIVEYGKPGTIIHPGKGWPVGRSQGGPVTYVKEVPLQVGYHYLTNTMSSPVIKQNMTNIAAKQIRKAVNLL